MIIVNFKNLNKSELVRDTVKSRVKSLLDKFIDLKKSRIQITLEMENSPTQAGPDLFKVKLIILGGRYNGITIEKSDTNLYIALADVIEHMLEALNRFGDKIRVKERKNARKLTKSA